MQKLIMGLALALLLMAGRLILFPGNSFAQSEPLPETDVRAELLAACPICEVDLDDYSGLLTQLEIENLLLALNDEYHAYAVYDQVIDEFGSVHPFVNIRRAEASHIRAVERLMDAYDVPIPENPWLERDFQISSTTEACTIAVDAEIENRSLYDLLFESATGADFVRVFSNLQWASEERHLPAFERCATRSQESPF